MTIQPGGATPIAFTLEQAQGELQALDQERGELDGRRDRAEAGLIDAQAAFEKVSGREARVGAHSEQGPAVRRERETAWEAQQEARRALAEVRADEAALNGQASAARAEVRRLEALLAELQKIELPDLGPLRGALKAVLTDDPLVGSS